MGDRNSTASSVDGALVAETSVGVLLVDDREDKLLSLEALLSAPGIKITKARSGGEALRCLLREDFAVILLDVKMPDMDGFETAALIRQRKRSEHTPIIFVSVLDSERYVTRGYELGAVDYLPSPVGKEALRAKVAVFVDLFRKSREVERQALLLRRRAAQLHELTEASLEIHAAVSVERMLQVIAQRGREIIGAHLAVVNLSIDGSPAREAVSLSERYSSWRNRRAPLDGATALASARGMEHPLRLSHDEMVANLAAADGMEEAKQHIPLRGWLSAPLRGREGWSMGLLVLSDKHEGEFTAEDEAIVQQLAQLASVVIENTLYRDAREANRLKDEFLATLSHELRTPLTAILGWVHILRGGMLDPSTSARGLEVIERNVKAQVQLIDDLLDVSRIIAGKLRLNLRPVNLAAIVRTAVDAVRPAAEARTVDVGLHVSPAVELVRADPDRLQQVIWNLLSNAIKFTPERGRVEVTLDRGESHIEIAVSDNGMGIEPEFLPHVFERFRQADSSTTRSHGGLGLGLGIVRHLVEMHGGKVEARSDGPGKGATFLVRLPVMPLRLDPAPERGPETPAQVEAVPAEQGLDGLQVLLVEDETDSRQLLVEVLEQGGARVTAVGSAEEALQSLARFRPEVLISDIGMPEEDGYTLLRKLRACMPAEGADIPALALTAFAREEDRQRALEAGFHVHLAKPVEPGELIQVVAQLARRCRGRLKPQLS